MKSESAGFTAADLRRFENVLYDHERLALAKRLEKASGRLAQLGPRVKEGHGTTSWSAHEVLAHIATLSKFYGVLVHKVSKGQLTELDFVGNVSMRDDMDAQMATIEPPALLQMVLEDQARTVKALRATDIESLHREVTLEDGRKVSAEWIARFPLINHLEEHVDQLERSLA
jgi:primosomal protein N''